jgi:hypothetical protein
MELERPRKNPRRERLLRYCELTKHKAHVRSPSVYLKMARDEHHKVAENRENAAKASDCRRTLWLSSDFDHSRCFPQRCRGLHNFAVEPLASAPRWGLFLSGGDSSAAPFANVGAKSRNLMIPLLLFSQEKQTRYPRNEGSRHDLAWDGSLFRSGGCHSNVSHERQAFSGPRPIAHDGAAWSWLSAPFFQRLYF